MRNATNIELDELIVHALNPRKPGGKVISECSIPLEDNQQLIKYFIDHIRNSLHNHTAKAASFEAIDQNLVSGICNDLLKGNTTLLDGSVTLAEKLYDIIDRDGRINPCDLAVCFYRVKNGEDTEDTEDTENNVRYLALLNIEPSEVFRHKTKTNSAGETYIGFELEKNIMPTIREKLQRCAFIRSLDPRSEYDMILLDKKRPAEIVGKFFEDDFLGAKPTFNDEKRTLKLYSGLINAKNRLRPELNPPQFNSLEQAIRVAMQRTNINVETWVNGLPLHADHKTIIKEEISRKIPDIEFDLDTEFSTTLTKTRSFRGDNNLRITYKTEDGTDTILKSAKRKEAPGAQPYYEVIIHTKEWKEIK